MMHTDNNPSNLKAILLWTNSDFPAYGNLTGCTVKGYKACPICGEKTRSIRLKYSRKISFMTHKDFCHDHIRIVIWKKNLMAFPNIKKHLYH